MTDVRTAARTWRGPWDGWVVRLLGGMTGLVLLVTVTMLVWVAQAGVRGVQQATPGGLFLDLRWAPDRTPPHFGITPFIVGTALTSLGAMLFGAAPAVLTALYASEFAPPTWRRWIPRVFDVSAAVPSVVIGYAAMTRLVPWLSDAARGCQGWGLASATLVLSVMIAPTVGLLSFEAMRRVSPGLRDAAAALGASRWQIAWRVVAPAASRGVGLALFLGLARAAGETIAVQMVAGNGPFAPITGLHPAGVPVAPQSCATFAGIELFRPMSTLSSRIIMDMPNTQPGTSWNHVLFSMSLILLVVSSAVVLAARALSARRGTS